MKKVLSLALAGVMMFSALPVAYAAEGENTYDNNYEGQMGTQISYMGTQEVENGGAGDVWTVTVPAKMVPGDKGTVKAEGMWAADKFLQVTHPTSVTLTYGAQSMDVAVTGGSFSLIGNSVDPVSKEVEISVEDATRLFGTWEGTIVYTVDLIEKGDVNRDGVIDSSDLAMLKDLANGTPTEDDLLYADFNADGSINNKDISIIKTILGQNGIEYMDE